MQKMVLQTTTDESIKRLTSSMKFDFASKFPKVSEIFSSDPISKNGEIIVVGSSVFFFGSFIWVPIVAWYLWRKKCTTKRRKALAIAVFLAIITAPLPRRDNVRKWSLWDMFTAYFSIRAVADGQIDKSKQYIFAVTPHGVFPFSVAFAAIGKMNEQVFNHLRVVIASSIHRFPIFRQILELIGAVRASKTIGASIMLFWGRLGLPIPFSVPLLYAVGKPIEVHQNPNPSAEEVEELHSRFCNALRLLFEKYKNTYGWHNKILKIV